MYVAPRGERARGGTAVLVRRGTDDMCVRGPMVARFDGRWCEVPISINGKNARVISIYAPVNERERGVFLRKLKAEKPFRKTDIVGGDFNCVPDVLLDSTNASYSNAHSQLNEAILANAGLRDIYRLYHGDTAQQYTRMRGTTHNRLDRIYAQAYASEWRWIEYGHDHASLGISDHAAVVATLQTAPPREPTAKEERIDPQIMRRSDVRRDVHALWIGTGRKSAPAQSPARRRQATSRAASKQP